MFARIENNNETMMHYNQGEFMKLKYKKIIMLTTISTMGIGLLTLSISQDSSKAKESLNPSKQESTLLRTEDVSESNELEVSDIALELTEAPTPSLTPIATPTPTPFPVYDFEEAGYPEIEAFVKDYYVAKSICDIEKIKAMSSDPSKVMTLEELQKETEYVEDYRNIKCYVKKGIEEGSYIVFIYSEIKFNGIVTLAPGLSRDYLITDSEGNLKSFWGEMDPELRAYYDERLEDADVKELRAYTEEKALEAKKADESLKTLWEYLDSVITSQGDQADQAVSEE